VFEWDEERYAAIRPCDPPRPALLHPGTWFPPERLRWATATPLWVRSKGLQLSRAVPCLVMEWWVTETGDWVALIDVTVHIGDQQRQLLTLVPRKALKQDPVADQAAENSKK
jgi:hypothetical protein